MNHSFNVQVAIEYSIEAGVLLDNFNFWITKNRANNKHYHDGKYWTYNSQQALSVLFPYWKRQKIQRILAQMEKDGLIEKGNYNKAKYDKTTWYTLTEKSCKLLGIAIAQNSTMESQDLGNGLPKDEQPIPYINTDINTDNIILCREVIEYLNQVANKNYKPTTKETKKHVYARINEGFTLDDFKKVIDTKTEQWQYDNKFKAYLRPQTLFGPKFESYLNEYEHNEYDIESDVRVAGVNA